MALMRLITWTRECTGENNAKENLPGKWEFKGYRLEKPGNCTFPFGAPRVSLTEHLCPNFSSRGKSTKSSGAAEEPAETGDTACVWRTS